MTGLVAVNQGGIRGFICLTFAKEAVDGAFLDGAF